MIKRTIFKAGLMLLALLAPIAYNIPTAQAEASPNDDFDSASSISALPYTASLNTSEAATAGDDPYCYGQGPTVWYAFTPATSLRVEANTFGSNYDTTLSVYTGTRGGLNQIACNDDTGSLQSRVRFDATAGQTYFFMVGAYSSGSGGDLTLSVSEAPPLPAPLTVDLAINRIGSVNRQSGHATISGTVTCSRLAYVNLNGMLRQKVGRVNVINGWLYTYIACEGQTPWSVTVASDNSNLQFTMGPATAALSAFVYDSEREEYISADAQRDVRLTGSRR